jgi:hypothetical protein
MFFCISSAEGEAQRFHDLQQQRSAIMFKDMKKTLCWTDELQTRRRATSE